MSNVRIQGIQAKIPAMRGAIAGLCCALLVTPVTLRAQDPVATVIARAGEYVESYQRNFAMVVSEERYEQEVRYPGPPNARGGSRDLTTRTILRSDFLLVRNSEGGWLPFRDVFEKDGMALRDRDERLAKLFLTDAGSNSEQARKIVDESARYNIGNINRTINLPTLPLIFLTDGFRARFDFVDKGRDDDMRVVQFVERGRPTYVSTTGGRDLPVTGRYWIEEASGRIVRTELIAADPAVDARIEVTYRPDETAGLWVPGRMEEHYRQRADRSEITGIASYSRFRRFQVNTTEDVAK
jgi:hypothetical protein